MAPRGTVKRWETKFGKFVRTFGVNKLAAALQIDRQSVYHWISGRYKPSLDSASALEKISGGNLTLQDIYSHKEQINGDE